MDTVPLVEIGGGGDVDHEPALLEREVLHGRADGRADDAVGSVAAEDVAGQQGLGPAGEPVGEVDLHPSLAVLGDVGDLDVSAQADGGLVLEVGPQQVLEFRLVEHVRPAGARAVLRRRRGRARRRPGGSGRSAAGRGWDARRRRTARRCPVARGCGRSRRPGARPAAGGRPPPSGPGPGSRRRIGRASA